MHKYNLTLKRIVSRFFLTGIVGVLFGVLMFPFLQVANGYLYEQRASIGTQNIIKMIVLWGLFTLIVSLYTFWKKHFRMVSVLLIMCFIVSILFFTLLEIQDRSVQRCRRATPYLQPQEFNRSLDLIAQRLGVDEKTSGTVVQSAFNFRNCLDIQYLESDNPKVEAYYVDNRDDSLQDLKIFVNPSYKKFDDLTLATLLIHEVIHAGQHVNKVTVKTDQSCYQDEAQAYLNQAIFISQLNDEERRSIYARLRENLEINPTLSVLLLTDQRVNESYNACKKLQKENSLTTTQFNQCVWTGTENKLLIDVQEDKYYQDQCNNR